MSKRSPISHSAAPKGAPRVWRSLEEREDPTRRLEAAKSEPEVAPSLISLGKKKDDSSGLGRRDFLTVSGVAAAAGLSGCGRRPAEHIMPYTRQPEYSLPGVALHF